MAIQRIDPSKIVVSKRIRKDLGDLSLLRQSIEAVGLLQPIVTDSNYCLIAGGRRLQVIKQLKWKTVPVNVVSQLNEAILAIRAEGDENTCRKPLVVSEQVELGKRLEQLEKPKAKERQKEGNRRGGQVGGKLPPTCKDKTRDKVGESVGMSGRNYEKAKAVLESKDADAIEQMDRTGKVAPAYNLMRRKKKQEELKQLAKEVQFEAEQPEWTLICGDAIESLKSLDEHKYARLIFADPPYNIGIDYGKGKKHDLLTPEEYIRFSHDWMTACWDNLTDDGSFWLLVADDFAAELCVEAKKIGFHLRCWIKWFEGFGQNRVNNFNRTTRHIFWFVVDPRCFVFHSHEVMRPSDRQTKYNDKRAVTGGKIENDLWDIPRLTGTCDERIHGFPTQIPIAITDRVIRCATDPGDLVIDPFNGSGTTGVSAIKNHRKYVGIDLSEEFISLADKRLRCVDVKRTS